MTSSFVAKLDDERLEKSLRDKKPLYTEAEARAEAERCLYCADAPCIKACPTEIDIPTFIKKIASGNVRGSAQTIFEQNLLGHSCARVCPVEVLCVGDCVYNGWGRDPIQIGRLQRYATQTTTAAGAKKLFTPKAKTGKKVALIGAGPASLACAGTLALEGHTAVIFEKRPYPGGLNTTGIAPYKLHVEDALHEVEWVTSLGVEIRTEEFTPAGAAKVLADYDAVFIGVGLGEDSKLGVPGEDGAGVTGATAWIEQMKLARGTKKQTGRVVVIGGGNTAIDVARESALLGAESVTMIYRRGEEKMSAYKHELDGGRKEGIRVLTHVQPMEFIRDKSGKLEAVRVAKTDENGKPIAGTEFNVPCDFAALAIGQAKLRTLASAFAGVEVDARGCIKADAATGQTGNPKVFSGGDCVNGGKEVVNAVAEGRNAARTLIARFEAEKAK